MIPGTRFIQIYKPDGMEIGILAVVPTDDGRARLVDLQEDPQQFINHSVDWCIEDLLANGMPGGAFCEEVSVVVTQLTDRNSKKPRLKNPRQKVL